MPNSLLVRGIRIGEGIPKICVPLVAKEQEEIDSIIETIMKSEPDMIEFRADYLIDHFVKDKKVNLIKILENIRGRIGDKVLLFTIRTKDEGGQADIDVEDYIDINRAACESGYIDMVDVEVFTKGEVLSVIKETAGKNNVYIVGSNHDFHKTPEEEEIIRRLIYMGDNGADIVKIAVMPGVPEEVLTLLSATVKYKRSRDAKPVITMSMGDVGVISRLSGEVFGSAVTFAAAGAISAPGQIPIDEVRNILKVLHKY